MIISLYDLQCEIQYDYTPPQIGGTYLNTGELERLSAQVTITSVKCQGIEIIKLVPDQQLLELEQELLEGIAYRN